MSTRAWRPLLLFVTHLSCPGARSSARCFLRPGLRPSDWTKALLAKEARFRLVPGAGKEKAQQESITLMLPAAAMSGGPWLVLQP